MKPIAELPSSDAASIRFILTDIDDTLTSEGRLENEAFDALWRLHEANLRVIPVTGRPAGWCDCIVRQWPIDAVIGENGAFALYWEEGSVNEIVHPDAASPDHRRNLDSIRNRVLSEVRGARVARDQAFRRFDLAIDFREDPPRLSYDVAERIAEFCREMGAEAKISSIHVNTWFGAYDKLGMARLFFSRMFRLGIDELKRQVTFCGDSPNDEPMFAFFPLACAVANIYETIAYISAMPTYVTNASHGSGFAEFAKCILEKRP